MHKDFDMSERALAGLDVLPDPAYVRRRLAENLAERDILQRLNRVVWKARQEAERLRRQAAPDGSHGLAVVSNGDAG
jgi:hypothetical protein